MGGRSVVRIALDLMHIPSHARHMRETPLPDDVQKLLLIAAGEDDEISRATEVTGRSRAEVEEAATFFIEQILLSPQADAYRTLGASANVGAEELRRNYVLLMRWLHPDKNRNDQRTIFLSRVTNAWENLKTPERREAYDQKETQRSKHGHSRQMRKMRYVKMSMPEHGAQQDGIVSIALRKIFGLPRE